MRMDYPGVSATTYYRPGESQKPPVTTTPFTATASGNASQSASGAVALTGHPGLWLVVGVVATFLILHKAGLDA